MRRDMVVACDVNAPESVMLVWVFFADLVLVNSFRLVCNERM